MANVKQTLEDIFMKAAEVFGKDESEKLLTKVFKETKAEEKANTKEEEKSNKRISRMTPTLANKLKAELVKAGTTFSNDDKTEKKEFDKFKKEFTSYVEDLTNDDFTAKGLEKHMEDFANSKKPVVVNNTAVEKEETAPAPAPAPAKVEKKQRKKATEKLDVEVKAPPGPTNAANIETLTLEKLQSIEMIATPNDGPIGVYWDAVDGRWVRGPDQDDDEDMTEKNFQGKTYAIGDKTGRVYEVTDDRDIFAGFVGLGAFKELKV
jgi:hypothetical protein